VPTSKEILSGDRLSPADEQTEIDDEISDQLKEDAGSRHDVAVMPQIPSGFGQNRGILFLAEDRENTPLNWRSMADTKILFRCALLSLNLSEGHSST
jgi:hypothetical protein